MATAAGLAAGVGAGSGAHSAELKAADSAECSAEGSVDGSADGSKEDSKMAMAVCLQGGSAVATVAPAAGSLDQRLLQCRQPRKGRTKGLG